MLALSASGALAGLAAGIEYTANSGLISPSFAQGWGFLAIPVALLGGLHPIAVVFSALYFGALLAGSEHLSRFTPAGTTLVFVIQAVAVFAFLAFRAIRAPSTAREEA